MPYVSERSPNFDGTACTLTGATEADTWYWWLEPAPVDTDKAVVGGKNRRRGGTHEGASLRWWVLNCSCSASDGLYDVLSVRAVDRQHATPRDRSTQVHANMSKGGSRARA